MLKKCFYENGEFNEDEFALLVKKFRGKILGYAWNFYLPGGDREDLFQWGMIGLYHAVLSFDESKGKSFYLIADINIKNMIKSAITMANRKKHEALNAASSLHCPITDAKDDSEVLLCHVLSANKDEDPLAAILERERVEYVTSVFRCTLSKSERKIMELYLEGYQQRQIAFELEMDKKVVDNAIQRARKKLITHFTKYKNVV